MVIALILAECGETGWLRVCTNRAQAEQFILQECQHHVASWSFKSEEDRDYFMQSYEDACTESDPVAEVQKVMDEYYSEQDGEGEIKCHILSNATDAEQTFTFG